MMQRDEIITYLKETDPKAIKDLYAKAYAIKQHYVNTIAYFRGIIEFSNYCTKNCYYCGIRRDNITVERFMMGDDEVVECARFVNGRQYGALVLQSGERTDEAFIAFVENLVRQIKTESHNQIGITLSLGEQTKDTYARWFEAGAHRYLLRIETTNRNLYQHLHPQNHSFELRLQCLQNLHDLGYQVGTGVMIGIPGQTMADLADDLLFFKKMDIDMIGMGPYLPHHETPLGQEHPVINKIEQLQLGLKMIAVTRLCLKDVNIAATTALQALDHTGREQGLQAGANIIMPNITHPKYRSLYQLYDGKPCLDENATLCRGCLKRRITGIGEAIGFDKWGDSPHYAARKDGIFSSQT